MMREGSGPMINIRPDFKKSNLLKLILAILILIAGLSLSQVSINYEKLTALGYIGVFLATLIGSSTILFPAPNIPVIIAGSLILNPFSVGIVGGLGWSGGEIVGYIIGRNGRVIIKDNKKYSKIEDFVKKYGVFGVFLFALFPNPVFDLVGIAAGILRLSFLKFFIPCLLGKTIDSIVIAYFGNQIFNTILKFLYVFIYGV